MAGQQGTSTPIQIAPVEKIEVIDQIIDRIAGLLEKGALKPGSPLPGERTLAEMLGVSRPTLRQALKALDVLGVLEVRPGSGTFVSKSIPRLLINHLKFMLLAHNVSLMELFETRKVIEVELARLAAKRATDEDIARMREILEQAGKHINDPEEYLSWEIGFHEAIFEAARNRLMEATMTSINRLLHASRMKTVSLFADLRESLEQHVSIFRAIEARNAEEAARAMYLHLCNVEKRLAGVDERYMLTESDG